MPNNNGGIFMKKIRVLFLSWQPAIMFSILSLFSDDPIISIKTKNFAELSKQVTVANLDYDMFLIDDAFSNREENIIANMIIYRSLLPKKIIYTGRHEMIHLSKSIKYGAKGIVSKYSGVEKLREAIIRVNKNENYFCEKVQGVLNNIIIPLTLLTEREKEIIFYMKEGLSNKEIASQLYLSVKTVERHKEEIKKKLKINHVADILKVISI